MSKDTMLLYHAKRSDYACQCFVAARDTEDAHGRLSRACRVYDRLRCRPDSLETVHDFDGGAYRVSLVKKGTP